MQRARIIFAGSPEFAVPPLQGLLGTAHDVIAVLTQPDRPVGRGRKLQAGPVKQAALDAGVPVLQPDTLKSPEFQAELRSLQPDLMVVVAYGQLLPEAVLSIPRLGCVNLHASLLPRWRGASPIQMAVLAGDKATGVGLMRMEKGLDTGPVFASRELPIGEHESAGELHDRLAVLGKELLLNYLSLVLTEHFEPRPQDEEGVSYAGRIRKQDGIIDWNKSATEIDRQIRAFNPWPVAQTTYQGQQLRCLRARPASSDTCNSEPGTVLGVSDDGLMVQTGSGQLLLESIQLSGRNPVDGRAFANAHKVIDAVLGNG